MKDHLGYKLLPDVLEESIFMLQTGSILPTAGVL
jgi:hypothetical protein